MNTPSIGVAFITHCAKHHLARCLPPFLNSPLKPRVVVVNSSSHDGTVEEAERMGAEALVIPRDEFNHGSTRERARKFLNTDIVVMVTPDAYARNADTLETLVRPLIEEKAAIAYARQLPHDGAKFFEAFPRAFNYPGKGHIRGIEDAKQYGAYLFFCSDSCAAYRNSALEEIGGFPSVLTGEDVVVTAKILRKGHKIAYVAEAEVQHSHHYGLSQEFKRHFDTGFARKSYQDLIRVGGRDEKRGAAYVTSMFRQLLFRRPWLLPYATLNIAAKWLGYRVGRSFTTAPLWMVKRLSSQDFYWTSKDFKKLIQQSKKSA